MKKIEMIVIKDPIYPKISGYNKKINSFYCEKNPTISNCFTVDEKLALEEKEIVIEKNLTSIEAKVEKQIHQYTFLKLFSRAAKRNGMFNVKLIEFDKYYNRLKQEVKKTKMFFNNIRRSREIFERDFQELVFSISDVYNFVYGIGDDLKKFEDTYYPKMKVTAYSLCEGKTVQELEDLIIRVNDFVNKFKSFNDSFDYICYNSGNLITDTVDALIECYKKANYDLKLKYFFESEVVIAFSYFEWIELIRKIKQTLSKYNNVKLSKRFNELFAILETRYAIIVIYNALMEV